MRGPEGRGKGKVRMDTEQGALELFVVPAGRSGMDTLMDLAAAYGGTEREKTLFVASSRELVQRARGRRLNAVNFEYLVHEILRRCAPAGVQRVPISRKTQELLLERLLDETFLLELDPDSRAYCQRENLRELARKKSFRQAMVALIGQLGRAGVTSEEFRRITETWLRDNDMPDKDRLAYISETICAIYGAYGTFLASLSGRGGKACDLESLYTEALQCLQAEKSGAGLPWRRIYVAGFHSFDPLARKIILALAKHCHVSVALPGEAGEEALDYRGTVYNVSRDSRLDLGSVKEREETVPPARPDRRPAALAWLLEQFRRPVGKTVSTEGHVRIWQAADARAELSLVLRDAKRSILEGMAPERIAIVVRQLGDYSGLRRGCDAYGIPARFPETASFSASPVLQYVLAFLTSLQGHGRDQALQLAVFLTLPLQELLWGFRIDKVKEAMKRKFYTDAGELWQDMGEGGVLPPELAAIQDLWEDAVLTNTRPIEGYCALVEALFSGADSSATPAENKGDPWLRRAGALYRQGALTLPAFKNLSGGRQQARVLLEHIRNDYGGIGALEQKLQPREFVALLTETAADLQVDLQRGKPDGVRILEASNMEEADFDKVYLLGMFEDKFPYARQESWIYNDQERQSLKAMGVDLPGTAESYDEDLHFFLSVCAAPRETLIFTCYKDERQTLSPYLAEVQALFSDLAVETPLLPAGEADALCAEERDLALAEAGPKEPDCFPEQGVLADEASRHIVQERLGDHFSASRLEAYVRCPFRFLSQYICGLRQDDALAEEADGGTVGTLIHTVLQRFVDRCKGLTNTALFAPETEEDRKLLADRKLDPSGETPESLRKTLRVLFREACDEVEQSGKVVPGPYWDSQKARLAKRLDTWLRQELSLRQVSGSSQGKKKKPKPYLIPVAAEVPFLVPLSRKGRELAIQGRIDRVDQNVGLDLDALGNRLFLTDYKTGSIPGQADFLNRNLQMPVYLYAAAQLARGNDREGKNPGNGRTRPDTAALLKSGVVAGGGYYLVNRESRRSNNFLYARDAMGEDRKTVKQELGLSSMYGKGKPWSPQDDADETDVDDAQALTRLLEESVDAILSSIERGEFRPTPEASCDKYCPAAPFCRFSVYGKGK